MHLVISTLLLTASCEQYTRAVPDPGPTAGVDACVRECVRARQMQAVSAEQIEKECRTTCALPVP